MSLRAFTAVPPAVFNREEVNELLIHFGGERREGA
jgi:hypothetical protein